MIPLLCEKCGHHMTFLERGEGAGEMERDEIALRFAVAYYGSSVSLDSVGEASPDHFVAEKAYAMADAFLAERDRQREAKP